MALILNYRTPQRVYECLASLADQGLSGAIVVDNSADNGRSTAEVQRLLAQGKLPLHVQLLDSGGNLGFAAGVNFGIRALSQACNGCGVLLMNSDARATPGMLAALRAASAGHSGPTLVEAEQVYADGRSRRALTHYHRALALFLRKPWPGAFRYLSGCCLLISATVAKAPLYDEGFFIYGEDIELSWRLRRAGIVLLHCDRARVIHDGGDSTRPGSFFYEYHMTRGHLLLARRLATGPLQSWLFTLLRWPMLWARAAWRSLRSGSLIPLRACWRAFTATAGTPVLPA